MTCSHLLFFLLSLFGPILRCSGSTDDTDPDFWERSGRQRLEQLLHPHIIDSPAKNIIVFIGDGMGISTVTAARIYSGQMQNKSGEEAMLAFDRFPYTALVKTYAVDRQVVDSAASATAMFTGVKTRNAVIGLSARAQLSNCDSAAGNYVYSFMDKAQEKGMATGFVTSTRVTHATPAALYSHSVNRDWEADSKMPKGVTRCKDIARQLIEDAPGNKFKVVLGGGLDYFKPKGSTSSARRTDGQDLVKEWMSSKENATFVATAQALRNIDLNSTEYLMGLFSPDHMDYALKRSKEQPSLPEMVETAIRMLKKSSQGFALMVEGGRIDHAHHENKAHLSLGEAEEMSRAVHLARSLTDLDDTLILVTADHSHSFVINGYPKRGNPIFGMAGVSKYDHLPYATLGYTNGPSKTTRSSNNVEHSQSLDYQQPVLVPLSTETHGGEDVALYASGPMAHLVRGVIEQNVLSYIIDYATCLGGYRDRSSTKGAATVVYVNHVLVFLVVITALLRTLQSS
ncbi:alkaline phosphatase, tissue-nonspecific isozyme-like isoform X1 [Ornithodoros turicata]